MVCDPIDGCDQIIIVDGSPNPTARSEDRRCHCRCWRDRRRVILHHLHDLPVAIEGDDPGHGSDCEDLAQLGKDHGARKGDHLVHHEFSTHTPYLARHCRQNLVGSLPRDMSIIVDELVEVRVREPDSDTERKK